MAIKVSAEVDRDYFGRVMHRDEDVLYLLQSRLTRSILGRFINRRWSICICLVSVRHSSLSLLELPISTPHVNQAFTEPLHVKGCLSSSGGTLVSWRIRTPGEVPSMSPL
jgi:hypothetical protein